LERDAGPPLSWKDFEESNLLSKSDEYPSDGGLALYSSGHFEGDIIADLVRSLKERVATHLTYFDIY
jgi:hypothetical protein